MKKQRLDLIDTLRGLAVISMIGFHACWIACFFGLAFSEGVIYGTAFTVWERSICMTFITISGFSFSLGRNHLKNGLVIFGLGAVVTLVTVIFVPEVKIIFGVLTFLGTAALLMIPIDKAFRKATGGSQDRMRKVSVPALVLCLIFFVLTYNINQGFLGFGNLHVVDLPLWLYNGYIATFLGFMQRNFVSADYFSLIPWFFLYLCGYFIHKLVRGTRIEEKILVHGLSGVSFIGRHALIFYIIHPVVLYGLIYVLAVYFA